MSAERQPEAGGLRLETAALSAGLVAGVGTYIAIKPPSSEMQVNSLAYEAEGVGAGLVAAAAVLGLAWAVKAMLAKNINRSSGN